MWHPLHDQREVVAIPTKVHAQELHDIRVPQPTQKDTLATKLIGDSISLLSTDFLRY